MIGVARQVLHNPRVSVWDVPTTQLYWEVVDQGLSVFRPLLGIILRGLTPISCMRLVCRKAITPGTGLPKCRPEIPSLSPSFVLLFSLFEPYQTLIS